MFRNRLNRIIDFAKRAEQVWAQTGDAEETKKIMSLELQAREDQVAPQITQRNRELDNKRAQTEALHVQLYGRPIPVEDTKMIAQGRLLSFVGALLILGVFVAVICNGGALYLIGWPLLLVAIGALVITSAVILGGYGLEWLLRDRPWAQGIVGVIACVLVFLGVFHLGEIRGLVGGSLTAAETPQSFVEDPYVTEGAPPITSDKQSLEQEVVSLLKRVNIYITFASDLALAMLMALFVTIRHDKDFTGWQTLKRLLTEMPGLERQIDDLRAMLESEKKLALAAIIRCKHFEKKPPPFLRMLPLLLCVLLSQPAWAQTSVREEGILIDVSKSVELFPEYMRTTRQMLQTMPPNSRLSVMLIASDSFGGTETLLRGWTPDAKGIFVDSLARARQQLVREFDSRTKGISATAESTDIFGAIWKMQTSLSAEQRDVASRDLYIFSDMVNAARGVSIAEMIAVGPQKTLDAVRAKGLVVPLEGYRVFVYGASTSGMSPAAYSAIRSFWTAYFKAAGAELVMYSPEVPNGRER